MGHHMMMPPQTVASNMKHPEAPPTHPCGPNTNFQYPTPMPFTFDPNSLDKHNTAKRNMQRPEHPIYQTTSSEIGRLELQNSDFHMRWYGLNGHFTDYSSVKGMALPKTRVNTGLNTSMDHSDVHHTFDQGWNGSLGLSDFNIANGSYAKQVVRPSRSVSTGM